MGTHVEISATIIGHHLERFTTLQRGLLLTALHTAGSMHNGQVRDDGYPYHTHVLSVHDYLLQIEWPAWAGIDIHLAALLHDVLEDCPSANLNMLSDNFSPRLAAIVLSLTKLDKQRRFTQIVEAVSRGLWESIFVKLADRLHNLSTIDGLEPRRITKKLHETLGPLVSCARECHPYLHSDLQPAFDELLEEVVLLARIKADIYC